MYILKYLLFFLTDLFLANSNNNLNTFTFPLPNNSAFPILDNSNKDYLQKLGKMRNLDNEYFLRRTSSLNCSNIFDIYSCFSSNDCYWCNSTNFCYNFLNTPCEKSFYYRRYPETTNDWIYNQIYLTPRLSACGTEYYDIYSTNEINIRIEGKIGYNQGCYWELDNIYRLPYDLNIKRQGPEKDKFVFADFNEYSEYRLVSDDQIAKTFKTEENIRYKFIIYKSLTEHDNSIEISIKLKSSSISISKIVTIILLVCGGIILILAGWILIYKLCIRPVQNQRDNQQNERGREIFDPQEVLKQFKETSIEECKKYDQMSCTICLLPHDQQAAIVELPCHHYFHSNCIKNWIYKKNTKPTCPNCNYDLLSHKIIPQLNKNNLEEVKFPTHGLDSASNQNFKNETNNQNIMQEALSQNTKDLNNAPKPNELQQKKCNSSHQEESNNTLSNLDKLQKQSEKNDLTKN